MAHGVTVQQVGTRRARQGHTYQPCGVYQGYEGSLVSTWRDGAPCGHSASRAVQSTYTESSPRSIHHPKGQRHTV